MLDFGPLSAATVKGDVDAVRALIANPESLKEVSPWGLLPLHLAVERPDVLEIILHATPSPWESMSQYDKLELIYLALRWSGRQCRNGSAWSRCSHCHCTDSIELLVSSDGCRTFWLTNETFVITGLLYASHASRLRVIGVVKSRRDQLKSQALGLFTPWEIDQFQLHSGKILDFYAPQVVQRLEEHGCKVPDLRFDRGSTSISVYHALTCTTWGLGGTRLADLFLTCGFLDIDPLLDNVVTPLACALRHSRPFDYPQWLISHGASLERCLHNPSMYHKGRGWTGAHSLFTRPDLVNQDDVCSESHSYILRDSALVARYDQCQCPCSAQGCSPASFLIRSLFIKYPCYGGRPTRIVEWLKRHTIDFTGYSDICMYVIRALTFEILGLRHTCCEAFPESPELEQDEVEEIADEQREMIAHLIELVGEFTQDLQKTNLDFAEFLLNHWAPQIKEALAELEAVKLTEEEKRAAESIGVKWNNETMSKKVKVRDLSPPKLKTVEDYERELSKIVHG